jgi:hypothetical protein
MQPIDATNLNKALLFLADKMPVQPTPADTKPIATIKDSISKEPDVFGDDTKQLITHLQASTGLPQTGELDENTAAKINVLLQEHGAFALPNGIGEAVIPGLEQPANYKVSGVVLNKNKEPIAGILVMAFDVDLKGARIYKTVSDISSLDGNGFEVLGSATTDGQGHYEVTFNTSQFSKAEGRQTAGKTADVIVYAVQDQSTIIGRSLLSNNKNYSTNKNDVNVLEVTNWNVIIEIDGPRGVSEYIRIMQPVKDLLEKSNVQLYELYDSSDQVEFLANETAQDVGKVTLLVQADKLINDAETSAPQNNNTNVGKGNSDNRALYHELLYGIGRQSVGLEWDAISRISIIQIINFLKQSSDSNIISLYDEQTVSTFAESLHSLATQRSIAQNPTLRSVLNIALKDDTLMEKFHSLYINHTGTPQEFWNGLQQNNDFKHSVDTLKLTNQLSALSGNNSSVMARLVPLTENNNAVKLLELSNEDWDTAIGTDIPTFISGASDMEKKDNYREFMRSQLHAAFYNQKVGLMTKNESEIKIADQGVRDKLNSFLTSTNFDLRFNRLHDKIAGAEDTFQKRLDDIGGEQKEDLKKNLNKVQRVFQFSPSPEVMTKILENGIDSATMVVSMPFSTFKVRYNEIGDEQTLLAIHQRASHIVSMIEYSILSLNRFSASAKIPAIAGKNNS